MPSHHADNNPLLLASGNSPAAASTVAAGLSSADHPDFSNPFHQPETSRSGRGVRRGGGFRQQTSPSTSTSSSASGGAGGQFDCSPGGAMVVDDCSMGGGDLKDPFAAGHHSFPPPPPPQSHSQHHPPLSLQPPPSVDESTTMASSTSGTSRSAAHDECVVCGDRASGFHYNAFSCEGCKGFFRRSILRRAVYACKYGDNCEMDVWMRRRCQACRLRRCLEVGMRPECLLSETQCRARESRRKSKRVHTSSSSTQRDSTAGLGAATDDQQTPPVSPLERLTPDNRELIENLVKYQELYEIPSESDIVALDVKLAEDSFPKDVPSALFQHMVNMTVLVTHLVVEFAKKLPGFLELTKDDQIVLLKGSASEVMVLRTARRYNPALDQVIFGDGTPVTRESLCLGGLLQDYVDDMFEFARRMSTLAVDNAEYALLTAICIFSDRPDLTDVSRVDVYRDRYVDALLAYERYRRNANATFLARLLQKLVSLRTLSGSHAEALRVLRVERGSLPQLLSEYFDVFD